MGEWPTWPNLLRSASSSRYLCLLFSALLSCVDSSLLAGGALPASRSVGACRPLLRLPVSQVLAAVSEAREREGGPEGLLFQLQIVLLPPLPCSRPPFPLCPQQQYGAVMEGSWEIRIGGKIFASLPTTKVEERREGGRDGAERRGEGRQPILCWSGDARQDECNKRWVSTDYQSFESSRLLIGSDQGADGIKTYVDRLMFYSSE